MVRMEFPAEMLEPAFLNALIRESNEDFIMRSRLEAAQREDGPLRPYFEGAAYGSGGGGGGAASYGYGGYVGGFKGEKPIQAFFDTLGLEEKETLNGIAVAGQCQFSCLADQLYGREITREWRADILLRRLALYVIATNEDEFRCFMLHANPKTRRQNSTAGESVDVEAYLRKMADNSTDGDHLTLQALCDALQCPVHVVQLVDSPLADKMLAHLTQKTVVMNELRPRLLPHLHPRIHRLQVQRRELWLTLRGEAHFRSLHCVNHTEQELAAAATQLQLLQSSQPDPPPTPAGPTAGGSSSSLSSSPRGQAAGNGRGQQQQPGAASSSFSSSGAASGSQAVAAGGNGKHGPTAAVAIAASPSPPPVIDTCSICLNDVLERPAPGSRKRRRGEEEDEEDDGEGESKSTVTANTAASGGGKGRVTRSSAAARTSAGEGGDEASLASAAGAGAGGKAGDAREGEEGNSEEDEEEDEGEVAVRPDSCQHVFHLGCLATWVKMTNACPNCKALIRSIERVQGDGAAIQVIRRGQRASYNHLGDDQRIGPEDYVDDADSGDDEEEELDSDASDPEDAVRCYVCSHANHARVLLLCDGDGCRQSAHTFCVGLQRVPDGQWFCRDCAPRYEAAAGARARPRRRSIGQWPPSAASGGGAGAEEATGATVATTSARTAASLQRRHGRRRRRERAGQQQQQAQRRRRLRSMGGIGDDGEDDEVMDEDEDRSLGSAGSRRRRRSRESSSSVSLANNALARELQQRHGRDVLPSTRPWGRVLHAANQAQRERSLFATTNDLLASAAAASSSSAGAAAAASSSRPASRAGRAGGSGGSPEVVTVVDENDEARQALEERERVLSRLQQQQRRRESAGSRKRASPTKIYEISSSSDDEDQKEGGREEAKSAPARLPSSSSTSSAAGVVTRRRSSSAGSASEMGAEALAAAAATTAAAAAGPIRPHIRPTLMHKRPKIEIPPSSSAAAAAIPITLRESAALGNGRGHAHGLASSSSSSLAESQHDIRGLLSRLNAAVEQDVRSIQNNWPADEMLRVADQLNAIFAWDQRDQARLLNAGLLCVLKKFLDPPILGKDDGKGSCAVAGGGRLRPGAYTPAHTKAAILKLLQVLPVGLPHLQESKLGPVLLAAYAGDSAADEEAVRTLVANWARFVTNVKQNGIPASRTYLHGRGWRSPPGAAAAAAPSYMRQAQAGGGGGGGGGGRGGRGGASSSYVPVTDPERLFGDGGGGGGGRRASAPAGSSSSGGFLPVFHRR